VTTTVTESWYTRDVSISVRTHARVFMLAIFVQHQVPATAVRRGRLPRDLCSLRCHHRQDGWGATFSSQASHNAHHRMPEDRGSNYRRVIVCDRRVVSSLASLSACTKAINSTARIYVLYKKSKTKNYVYTHTNPNVLHHLSKDPQRVGPDCSAITYASEKRNCTKHTPHPPYTRRLSLVGTHVFNSHIK